MPRLVYFPTVGGRTVLAMTCSSCGDLLPESSFDRRSRLPGGTPYLDRRCRDRCRWRHMEDNELGRHG